MMMIRAVSFDERSVGKTFGDSKMKTTWLLRIQDELKEISLTNSRLSGKKKVFVGDNCIHECSNLFRGFTYTFRLMGSGFMIVPNSSDSGYDLFVNGVSFFDLPGNPSLNGVTNQLPSTTLPRQQMATSSTSRFPTDAEDLQLQRAIEISLREEAKRKQKQQLQQLQQPQQPPMAFREFTEYQEPPKVAPPRVPAPRKRPVVPTVLQTEEPVIPATSSGVHPDLIDLSAFQTSEPADEQPPFRVHAVEEFDIAKESSPGGSAAREGSQKDDDPIMDWFKEVPDDILPLTESKKVEQDKQIVEPEPAKAAVEPVQEQ